MIQTPFWELESTTNQKLNWARERRKMTAEQTPPRFRLMAEFDPFATYGCCHNLLPQYFHRPVPPPR
jgi:hypothetical protein